MNEAKEVYVALQEKINSLSLKLATMDLPDVKGMRERLDEVEKRKRQVQEKMMQVNEALEAKMK